MEKKKIRKNHIARSKGEKIAFVIAGIFFFLYAMTFVYTLGWALITSLRDKLDFIRDPFKFPGALHFSNYVEAFQVLEIRGTNMFGMLLNSLWYAVGGTVLSIFFTNLTAYTLSKYRFIGDKFLYYIAIFAFLLPVVGALPQQYALYGELQILDSPLYLITFMGGFGFNFILFYGFYKSVAWDYAEAVFIDGGGHFTVYFHVMLPQSLSMCLALGIVQFIGLWNDYATMVLFLPEYPTLANGLYQFQFMAGIRSNYPLYFAAIIMCMIPVLTLYAAFQEQIMTSMVTGGLKG